MLIQIRSKILRLINQLLFWFNQCLKICLF